MAFGPQPPGEAGANVTAYLIKQRVRTDCPQLTDVPSDLRVNGARHASLESAPPSKPERPPNTNFTTFSRTAARRPVTDEVEPVRKIGRYVM
jgi:hypothetical protein